jgi:hypothetical protein
MIVSPGDRRRRPAAATLLILTILLPTLAAAQQPEPPITGEPLASPSPGWSGDVAPPERALPPDFWHGTARALAEILLSRLPDTGEAVLASLLVAGPGQGDPLALDAAIGGLERGGLDGDARRLAVEAALAAGL